MVGQMTATHMSLSRGEIFREYKQENRTDECLQRVSISSLANPYRKGNGASVFSCFNKLHSV